jgi:hypothetical protein
MCEPIRTITRCVPGAATPLTASLIDLELDEWPLMVVISIVGAYNTSAELFKLSFDMRVPDRLTSTHRFSNTI